MLKAILSDRSAIKATLSTCQRNILGFALRFSSSIGEAFEPLCLNNLSPNPGSKKQRRRVGRGIGSGRGKTCGRGHKGQKKRKPAKGGGFIGGQTPLHRSLPKRGFSNKRFQKPLEQLNLGRLQLWIDMGRLIPKPDQPITLRDIKESGLISRIKHGVKLLAKEKDLVHMPLNIEVTRASKEAIKAVEEKGGSVVCSYFNRLGLRAHLFPHKFHPALVPRRAAPPPKIMPYYLDYNNRGYLSPEIQLKKIEEKRKTQVELKDI
uniref:Large ribosomal subunit protein uL15/eL18 domain-containing protein n=1 Tax=Fibrocapsa japonica TaxID=94617 RepID=A0A7S2V348_9STRA